MYDKVIEHYSYGEDEITINYEESKVWGIKLYDKDNLLVNSTDTNIRIQEFVILRLFSELLTVFMRQGLRYSLKIRRGDIVKSKYMQT